MAAKTHPGADNQIYTQAGKNRADNANHLASDQFVDGKIISLPDPNYASDFWDIQRGCRESVWSTYVTVFDPKLSHLCLSKKFTGFHILIPLPDSVAWRGLMDSFDSRVEKFPYQWYKD